MKKPIRSPLADAVTRALPSNVADAIAEAQGLDGENAEHVLRAFELLEVFAGHVDAQPEMWKHRAAHDIVRQLSL